MQSLPVRCLARVGVRSRVGELVAVGRSATEEPALVLRLRFHRVFSTRILIRPRSLLLMPPYRPMSISCRRRSRVDPAADLWHPQLDVMVSEHREGEPELAAVERSRRLADDDGTEATVRALERFQQL